MPSMLTASISACVLAMGMSLAATAQEPSVQSVEISHVSGKPVPRFESLRFDEVNGRLGPSEDHPIVWTYVQAGLPLLVIKETRGWRCVRDPDGDEVWVHERTLTDTDQVFAARPAVLRASPMALARPVAQIERGAMVTLNRCDLAFCRIQAQGYGGWVDREALWGVDVSGSTRIAKSE